MSPAELSEMLDNANALLSEIADLDREFAHALGLEDQTESAEEIESLLMRWVALARKADPTLPSSTKEHLFKTTYPIQQLHHAIEKDNASAVMKLLELGVDPYTVDANLASALRSIARARDPILISQMLVAAGHDLQQPDSKGMQLVHYAATAPDEGREAATSVNFLHWLADEGVNLDSPVLGAEPSELMSSLDLSNAAPATAAGLAFQGGHKKLLATLLSLGASDQLLDRRHGDDLLRYSSEGSDARTELTRLVSSSRARTRALKALEDLPKRPDDSRQPAASH